MKTNKLSLGAFLAAFVAIALLPATPLSAQSVSAAANQAPKAISQPKPDYSFQLRRDDVEGVVTVSFTITSLGDVTDVALVSSTQRRLDKPTLSAIKTWKFQPGIKGGQPVSSKVIQAVAFSIPERSA